MGQAILTIASLSLLAALCQQLLDGNRFFGTIRMVLGLEIAWVAVSLLDGLWSTLN